MAEPVVAPVQTGICRWCDRKIELREMFRPDFTGSMSTLVSLGLMWVDPAPNSVCDMRPFEHASDHHEPLTYIPDLADRTAVATWLDA